MAYNHGIRVEEQPTSWTQPVLGTAGLQVVFGTAPIHLAKDPSAVVNKPILVYSFDEARELLGYSEDFDSYTLCQSMFASFRLFRVAPVIFCNVLDPEVHRSVNASATYAVTMNQVVLPQNGIFPNSVVVKNAGVTLASDDDYVLSFNALEQLVVTLIVGGAGDGATTLEIESVSIDPSAVTAADVIGGRDFATGKESGLEVVRQVYPTFGMTAGLILAPGWSHIPEVGAVIAEKSIEVNGVFRCENILDLDTNVATKYTECKALKDDNGYNDKHSIVLWPMVSIRGKKYYYSAIYGALVASTDAANGNVPDRSPSNLLLGITGACLDDGTEVVLDQTQAGVLNGGGIVTALRNPQWKAWGNNTAAYPENKDPKDRWISCRRMFSWWGNSFLQTYNEKVDSPANNRLIESIIDAENVRGNTYVAQGKLAGARMEYRKEDNTIDDILSGKLTFRQYLAPYVPAEDILNIIEFDPSMLETALGGE
jgi:Phage tail sheath protein FI